MIRHDTATTTMLVLEKGRMLTHQGLAPQSLLLDWQGIHVEGIVAFITQLSGTMAS